MPNEQVKHGRPHGFYEVLPSRRRNQIGPLDAPVVGDFGSDEFVVALDPTDGSKVGDGLTRAFGRLGEEDRAFFRVPDRFSSENDLYQHLAEDFPYSCTVVAFVVVNRDLPQYDLVFGGAGSYRVDTAELIENFHVVEVLVPQ